MKITARQPDEDTDLDSTRAEKLRELLKNLEAVDFAGIQKDLGKHERERNAMDVLVCSSNCLGVN